MIIIELFNTDANLKGLTDPKILKEIDYLLSYQIQGFQFMAVGNHWDGRYRLFKNNGKFPIGMLQTVIDILKKHKLEYQIKDGRNSLDYGNPIPPISDSKFAPRDYQMEAIKTCIQQGSGIVRMCTGSGKTFVISSVVAHYNVPSIIYVISIDLLYQMVETLKKSYGIDAGMIGDGHCQIKKINVATIWSAATAFEQKLDKSLAEDIFFSKKKESNKDDIKRLVNSANLIVLDEAHFAGSDTFQFLAKVSTQARHRFLFSATPWRENGDSILLEAVAGPKIMDISASYLIEREYLVQPKILFKEVPKMESPGKTYHDVYKNYIEDNPIRNNLAVMACKNFVKSKKKVLILIKKVNHGKTIKGLLDEHGIRSAYLDGSKSSEERMNIISMLESDQLDVIIASSIFNQGVDVPMLDVLINVSSGKSKSQILQKVGRVLRTYKNKKTAYVLDFYDNCKFLKDHSKARIESLKSEKKFLIKTEK